jgi:hypothetical protein
MPKTTDDQSAQVCILLDAAERLEILSNAGNAKPKDIHALRAGSLALTAIAQRMSYGDANGVLADFTNNAIQEATWSNEKSNLSHPNP